MFLMYRKTYVLDVTSQRPLLPLVSKCYSYKFCSYEVLLFRLAWRDGTYGQKLIFFAKVEH
jgi:hypothetical protein